MGFVAGWSQLAAFLSKAFWKFISHLKIAFALISTRRECITRCLASRTQIAEVEPIPEIVNTYQPYREFGVDGHGRKEGAFVRAYRTLQANSQQ